MSALEYHVDPSDPRAPPQEVWDRLTAEQRARVVASLPSDYPRASPPEGDLHRLPKVHAYEALDEHFRSRRRGVYLGSELPVYYPDEALFAPDLIAILDVDPHARERWVVADEKRGLDFVLEVHVSGERAKDFDRNVTRFARLGIPEYFIFDPPRTRLLGYRLDLESAEYKPILPQGGRWTSEVLDLDLGMEGSRLRFYVGSAVLPDAAELRARLAKMVDSSVARAEAESARADAEAARAHALDARVDSEAARAERLAAKLRELGVDPDDL